MIEFINIKKLDDLERGVEITNHFDILTKVGILDVKQSRSKYSQFDVDTNLFYRFSSLGWFLSQAEKIENPEQEILEYDWQKLPKLCTMNY